MTKIIFNACFRNTHKRIHSISGRMGDFIFRTSGEEKISAFYKPKKTLIPDPSSDHCRTIIGPMSVHCREMVDYLGLVVVVIFTLIPLPNSGEIAFRACRKGDFFVILHKI